MKRVAEVYAAGLYDAAQAHGCVETIAQELCFMMEFMEKCGKALRAAGLAGANASALIREVLGGHVHRLTLEFMLLMLSRHQIKFFPDAAKNYRKLCGMADEVVSLRIPYELDEDTFARLKARLTEVHLIPAEISDTAKFEIDVDEGILGGFIAAYGGYQLDASLKTALQKIKQDRGM